VTWIPHHPGPWGNALAARSTTSTRQALQRTTAMPRLDRQNVTATASNLVTSHFHQQRLTQMRRKRCLRSAEPATARATYLERNRKAAKKCRSKQRRQQEELVETARAMERQNKALKAEVESLQVRVLGLMQLIGQHADCLFTCLKINPRLQEPRLAPGNQREALPSLLPGDPYCRNNPAGQVTFPGKH
jgi:hypothetical protein